jgi:hypothetical protein
LRFIKVFVDLYSVEMSIREKPITCAFSLRNLRWFIRNELMDQVRNPQILENA